MAHHRQSSSKVLAVPVLFAVMWMLSACDDPSASGTSDLGEGVAQQSLRANQDGAWVQDGAEAAREPEARGPRSTAPMSATAAQTPPATTITVTPTQSMAQPPQPDRPEVDWPRAEVFEPTKLFSDSNDPLARRVLAANPRFYVYDDFAPGADPVVVVGMPGWGGRSENFIWTLINGLKHSGMTSRLVLIAIQDLSNGGPTFQGQGDRAHANLWQVPWVTVSATRHLLAAVAQRVGKPTVYFMGFSTGGTAAPVLASRVPDSATAQQPFRVGGAVALGTPSPVSASRLVEHGQRVLFLVAPRRLPGEPAPDRDDQRNREGAELSFNELKAAGADVQLRHISSVRYHVDWHWGLVSQCRYFRSTRIDEGRGYWPNYAMPNPETMAYLVPFLRGETLPAEGVRPERTRCPY